ncbi:nucleotide kinase [Holotrichia oblita]|nr:nucleotide kinase [Holotrichia oblita]
MRLIVLGPQGCGKGTQAKLINKEMGIPHISTGDIFRANMEQGTELGKIAKEYVNKGQLVPLDITVKIVKDRIEQPDCEENGFCLDGFPRNREQAEALDKITDIDRVILIELPREELIKRLSIRRDCKDCAHITRLDWLINGKCEKCGGQVFQREDATEEAIQKRLEIYDTQTAPLIDFYKNKGILQTIQGQDKVEDTFALTKAALKDNCQNFNK